MFIFLKWIEDLVGNNLGLCFQGLISRTENEELLNNWQQTIQKLPPVVQDAFYNTILHWDSKYIGNDVLKSWRAAMNDSLLKWNQQTPCLTTIPTLSDLKNRLFNLRLSERRPKCMVLTYQDGNGKWVCHLCFLDEQTEKWKLELDDQRKSLSRFLHEKKLNVPVPHPGILEIFSLFEIDVDTYFS